MGEATEPERERVQQWLDDSADNGKYLAGLRRIWNESRQLAAKSEVDTDAAWTRFRSRVAVSNNTGTTLRRSYMQWMRRAAAILLLLGLGATGWWWFNQSETIQDMTVVSQSEVVRDTLPDGSRVALNKQSSIHYPSRFAEKKRAVQLQGEAFFDVVPDSKQPFEVEAGKVTITVLGTSFNVKERNGRVEVVVESGKVQVGYEGQQILLTAGEKAIIEPEMGELGKEAKTDQLHSYYRDRVFVCDNTPLWRLVEVLNEAYDVRIIFGRSELRNYEWNITIDNESLDQVLNLISQTFDIKVVKRADTIILQ